MVKVNLPKQFTEASKDLDVNNINLYRQHLNKVSSQGWSSWYSKESEDISAFTCTACLQVASMKYCFDKAKYTGKCCRLGDTSDGCNNHN